ncbi:hypothetical protein C0J52_00135, partial [Blattella germanica]
SLSTAWYCTANAPNISWVKVNYSKFKVPDNQGGMFLKTVCCCLILITFGTATFTNENQRYLAPRESRYPCCRGSDHIPYRNFNDRRDYDPPYKKYGHEYNDHRYQDRPYYRPNRVNYYDYKQPLPPPPPPPPSILPSYVNSKDYYTRRYDKPSYLGPKYMQNRVGFSFPDTENTNVKEGNGGYRPYVPSGIVKFKDSKYYDNQDYDNFRDKNEKKFYPQDVIKRKKYKPGLLQSISLGNPGTVIASGPNGIKHVIHDLPPWADIMPEKENFEGPYSSKIDHRGGVEYAEPHRFSSGFHGKPIPGHHSVITGSIYVEDPRSTFDKNKNHGSSKDIITSEGFGEYDKHIKPEQFRPSPPFYRYSEPDPIYHPNGSPLQTYPTTEATESPVTKPTTTISEHSTSEQPSKYPDSINAQLPPTTEDADTRVPYVAATAVTEQIPEQHITVVTQATEATQKDPLLKLASTASSDHNTTTPTTTTQERSPSDEIKIFLPSIPIKDTPAITSKSDEFTIGLYLPKNVSKEIKIYLPTIQNQNSSPTVSSSDKNASSTVNPTVIPFIDTSSKSSFFLPTVIAEKLSTESSVKDHTVSSEDNQSNRKSFLLVESPPESLTTTSAVTDHEAKDEEFKKPMVIVVPDSIELSKGNNTPAETESTSTALRLTSVAPRTETLITTQSTEHLSEKTPLTTLMQSATEQTDLVDNLSTESQVSEVKNPSSLNHLQTLVNHARTLDYLQHGDGTTNIPLEDND